MLRSHVHKLKRTLGKHTYSALGSQGKVKLGEWQWQMRSEVQVGKKKNANINTEKSINVSCAMNTQGYLSLLGLLS